MSNPEPDHRSERSVIRASALDVDRTPGLQRPESACITRARQIADAFDPDALGVFQVSARRPRTPTNHIMDGQTRRIAVGLRGLDNMEIEVEMHYGLTLADEARLFRLYNTATKPRPLHTFLARVLEGDTDAVAIDALVRRHGQEIGDDSHGGHIRAVAALEAVYGKGDAERNPEALDFALGTMIAVYGPDEPLIGDVLHGLGVVYRQFGRSIDRDVLVAKLAAHPGGMHGILGEGRTRRSYGQARSVARGCAYSIVDLYNVGRRSRRLALDS
jgi:hypothetical protein